MIGLLVFLAAGCTGGGQALVGCERGLEIYVDVPTQDELDAEADSRGPVAGLPSGGIVGSPEAVASERSAAVVGREGDELVLRVPPGDRAETYTRFLTSDGESVWYLSAVATGCRFE